MQRAREGRASSHRRVACRAPRGGGALRRRRGTAPVMRVGRSPCAVRPERRCGELRPISARRSTCSRAAGGAPPLASVPIEGRVAIPRTVAWSAVSHRSHHASFIRRVDPSLHRMVSAHSLPRPFHTHLHRANLARVRSFGLTPRPTRAPAHRVCLALHSGPGPRIFSSPLILLSQSPIDVVTSASASPVQRHVSSSSRHCL